jgi:outer membrane protein OmpA-like peptidoglycan-associated protein
MKPLAIGFCVFLVWSALSTWFYVCRIKGLCYEKESVSVSQVEVKKGYTTDSLPNTMALKPAELPGNLLIYFAFDKSSFAEDSSSAVYANKSLSYMFRNSESKLLITGHTDSKGSDKYNLTLGYRRAVIIQDYFESKGVPEEKIVIDSKGENEPAESNNNDKGRAKNRRTEVTIKN